VQGNEQGYAQGYDEIIRILRTSSTWLILINFTVILYQCKDSADRHCMCYINRIDWEMPGESGSDGYRQMLMTFSEDESKR
jgi:hypothetical protein